MSAPRTEPRSTPSSTPRSAPETDEILQPLHAADTASDVVRWAAFSCVLVPVVLVWYGTSLAGAAGAALGLAAVTCVCRVLLRQSERVAARAARSTAARSTAARSTAIRSTASRSTDATGSTATARSIADDHTPQRGRHGRSGSGAHRGGRHSGPSTPVD